MPLRQRRILNYLVRKGRFRAQMAKSSLQTGLSSISRSSPARSTTAYAWFAYNGVARQEDL